MATTSPGALGWDLTRPRASGTADLPPRPRSHLPGAPAPEPDSHIPEAPPDVPGPEGLGWGPPHRYGRQRGQRVSPRLRTNKQQAGQGASPGDPHTDPGRRGLPRESQKRGTKANCGRPIAWGRPATPVTTRPPRPRGPPGSPSPGSVQLRADTSVSSRRRHDFSPQNGQPHRP